MINLSLLGSAGSACSSPRHAMEQMVDADLDVDVDADVDEVDEAMEYTVTGLMTAIYFTLAIYIDNLNVCPVDALSVECDS
jgi:hypothetical protein